MGGGPHDQHKSAHVRRGNRACIEALRRVPTHLTTVSCEVHWDGSVAGTVPGACQGHTPFLKPVQWGRLRLPRIWLSEALRRKERDCKYLAVRLASVPAPAAAPVSESASGDMQNMWGEGQGGRGSAIDRSWSHGGQARRRHVDMRHVFRILVNSHCTSFSSVLFFPFEKQPCPNTGMCGSLGGAPPVP